MAHTSERDARSTSMNAQQSVTKDTRGSGVLPSYVEEARNLLEFTHNFQREFDAHLSSLDERLAALEAACRAQSARPASDNNQRPAEQ